MEQDMRRLTSCWLQVRRSFGADWERIGSRQNGNIRDKVVKIEHPMEGVHCVKDVCRQGIGPSKVRATSGET